jgi:hypothetical protein
MSQFNAKKRLRRPETLHDSVTEIAVCSAAGLRRIRENDGPLPRRLGSVNWAAVRYPTESFGFEISTSKQSVHNLGGLLRSVGHLYTCETNSPSTRGGSVGFCAASIGLFY